MVLYIGPGIGIATFIVVGLVLLLVLASLAIVMLRPIRKALRKLLALLKGR